MYNHGNAMLVRQRIDSENKMYNTILSRMGSSETFFGFVREEGTKITYKHAPYSNLRNLELSDIVITAAEVINDCMELPNIKSKLIDSDPELCIQSKEDLFGLVLDNLLLGLTGIQDEQLGHITEALGVIYDTEI
jgi:hypothetical protein